jgi:hypothetical protein
MPNKGISPIDTATALGQLRANLGDINSVALAPPEAGFVDYVYFADAELETFLLLGSSNVTRATAHALIQLSTGAALVGKSIKTDDLGIDIRGRGKDLLDIATALFKQANEEDALAARADSFFELIVPC